MDSPFCPARLTQVQFRPTLGTYCLCKRECVKQKARKSPSRECLTMLQGFSLEHIDEHFPPPYVPWAACNWCADFEADTWKRRRSCMIHNHEDQLHGAPSGSSMPSSRHHTTRQSTEDTWEWIHRETWKTFSSWWSSFLRLIDLVFFLALDWLLSSIVLTSRDLEFGLSFPLKEEPSLQLKDPQFFYLHPLLCEKPDMSFGAHSQRAGGHAVVARGVLNIIQCLPDFASGEGRSCTKI